MSPPPTFVLRKWRLVLIVALALFCQACGQSGTGASEGAATGANLSPLQRGTVGVEATYSTQSDWGSGFVGQIALTNKGTSKVTDWQIEFDLASNIDSIWNAKILSHTGQHYVLGAQSYNNSLNAGQSVTLGFQGSPGLKGATAQGLTVTGEGGSAPSPTPRPSPSPAAPTPSPSPAAPAASPSPAASTGSLTFVKDDDWGSGFTAHITLTNQGTTTITDWQIEADWDRTLTGVWNGVIVSSGSGKIRFGPASYNRTVAPGASVSVGFQGNPGQIGSGPSALRLVGGTTTTPSATPTPTPGASATPTPNPSPAAPSATPTPVPTATGWFHTQGSDIVDANGNVVRITGVNWFGLETSNYTPHGLWSRNLDDMVAQMSQNGYNTMRVPYCNQMFDAGSTPNSINYALNPDLQGKSALQILDALVASAGKHNMRIILDRHRPDSGGQSELWYTSKYSEARWISDWEMLATRYKNNPTVIGCDLHNEPHGSATWGDGNANTDWRAAAERCGNRILAANPNLLILVEGIERVGGDNYWWGGNLMAAGAKPVTLNVAGRVVYSPHDYPSTVYNQSWFSAANYPNNLDGVWDTHWGYLLKNKTAPVLLGEFGTKYETSSDKLWLQRLVGYLSAQKGSFTYWSWNPNSGDTGGILKDDWKTINTDKQAVLQPILAPKL